MEHPCVACSSEVRVLGIQCDLCNRWCHPGCAHMNKREYERLGGCDDPWLCPGCCLPSLSSSLFELSSFIVQVHNNEQDR